VRVELPLDHPFDYQLAMNRLARYRAPRNKILSLCRNGDLIQIKKGLYVASPFPGRPSTVNPLAVAALIYGPSYVSLESALSHYGLIPERVDEITSVTCKRAKQFQTPLGRYSYRPVNESAFSYGVALEAVEGGSFFLAEPEKALCDRIACIRHLSAMRDIPAVLEEHLRVDLDAVVRMRVSVVRDIAKRYRRRNVDAFLRWLERHGTGTA
jgi:predicted transcriptional regulator of viral defense system